MLHALLATIAVALVSFSGALAFGKRAGRHVHTLALPIAVGVFLGIVFFELVPETLHAAPTAGPVAILAGFFGFYLLASWLHTFHHHHEDPSDSCIKSGGRMLLIGDAVHNLADGVVIASAFLINPAIGIATTIGVILHELPQEIAEFGVLLASGYSRGRALFLNFLSASSVILGAAVTILFAATLESHLWILTGIAAGNLLYIATSDLLPEVLAGKARRGHSIALSILGAVFIWIILAASHAYMDAHGVEHSHEHGHDEEHADDVHELESPHEHDATEEHEHMHAH